MNKTKMVAFAILLGFATFVVYKANQIDNKPVVVYPDVTEIGPSAPVDAPTLGDTGPVIEVTEPIVVVGKVDKAPFRHGSKLCQWYEDAGMRAVADMDGWAESTCSGNTCFLLVHDANMPAPWVMAAWLSESRNKGHDPRKENIELSVFTFEGEAETDHVTYFPKRDVFESY